MHPTLFEVPLPAWTISLLPGLLVVAGLAALLAVFGWRKKAIDLLVIGGVVAALSSVAALVMRGQTYTLSSLPIYSYGGMLCLSLVVGWFLTLGLAERDGLPRDVMANCYIVTALVAFAGSRLLYVATNPSEFGSLSEMFALRRGGFVAYGGFLGGFLGSWLFLRRQRLRLMPWADVAVPSLATGLIITRIGCYLFGCDFGKPLAEGAPGWLKKLGTFPRWSEGTLPQGAGSPAFIQHVNQRGLSPDADASLPVHPTQLYEALAGVLLLGLVFLVRRHQRFRGQVFFAFTFAYGLLRFTIEILRDDLERGEFGPYLAEHVYYTIALLIFAAAYVYGPSRCISKRVLQRATQALAVVPAVLVYVWFLPAPFAMANPIQLSTSQWIALFSAVAVAFAWAVYERSAELHPEAAMSLGTSPLLEGRTEAAELRDEPEVTAARDEPEANPDAPASGPSERKRRKRRKTKADSPEGKRKHASEPSELPAEADEAAQNSEKKPSPA